MQRRIFWPSDWMAWEQSLEAFAFRRGSSHAALSRLGLIKTSSAAQLFWASFPLSGTHGVDHSAVQRAFAASRLQRKALEICGFVSKHPDWSLKTGKPGKSTLYRLSDNYLRFYIHYIEPNLAKIEQGSFLEVPLSGLPGWEPMLGFQLENLLLKNRPLIYQALGIHAQDIVIDNPYFEKPSSRKKGCQIDYLIQTRSNTLFVCEVKMRRRELGLEVIDAMKTKIASLSLPKGFGISPVLLHLGPVSDALLSSRYFFRMIDIADL